MQKEIGVGANDLVGTTAYLFLSYKRIGKKYEQDELFKLIEQSDKLEFEINFCIYQLLEDKIYLETAHTQIQEIANNLLSQIEGAARDIWGGEFSSLTVPIGDKP